MDGGFTNLMMGVLFPPRPVRGLGAATHTRDISSLAGEDLQHDRREKIEHVREESAESETASLFDRGPK